MNASKLNKVVRAKLRAPARIVIYGPEGVGKSTLAADAPNPIWIDAEDGSGLLTVSRYPFRDEPNGHVPTSYMEILEAIEDLTTSEHDFKTLVLDTVDRIESLIWAHVVAAHSGKSSAMNKGGKRMGSLEEFGFGKGFQLALDEWRSFAAKLDRLRGARGMDIVLLAHAQVKTFKSPDADDFDRYQLRLNEKAASFIREWADVCGFAHFEQGSAESADGRSKGFSTGRRLLKFERSAAYDAKSRLVMPKEIEVGLIDPWKPFAEAIAAGNVSAADLKIQIQTQVDRIGDEILSAKVKAAVAGAAEDTSALSRFLNKLIETPTVTKDQPNV
jgi:hypothetical protein